MRIALADDHLVVREGIRLLLQDVEGVEIVGEAADANQLLDLLAHHQVDVVILDLRMPGADGFEALERIRRTNPTVRTVVLSMFDDPTYVRRAIELGASAYLLKNVERSELLAALKAATTGGAYVQRELIPMIVGEAIARPGTRTTVIMSEYQSRVLKMVADGKDTRTIARELESSENAVKTALHEIFRAMGVRTRSQAVAEGFRRGLLE